MFRRPTTAIFARLTSRPTTSTRLYCAQAPKGKNVRAGGSSTSSGGRGPISWAALVLFAAGGTGALAYYAREKERRMQGKKNNSPKTIFHLKTILTRTLEVMKPRAVGRASIGGPFELTNGHDGKKVNESLLLGHWSLVYFGFVQCPDICPAELSKVGEALGILEKQGVRVSSKQNDGADLMPIFISIDPERDSPKQSAEYAQCFHEEFVGLSGTMEEVKKTAKAYRVYYSKDDEEKEDYLVDHSIITYLMDPSGEFSEFYGKNTSSVEMATKIRAQMIGNQKNSLFYDKNRASNQKINE